ncbi:hypothetical protein FPANT_13893 [Fusarium pseudoanthophilum]|uniref:Uncharacterized protein n=1 Tax=Fusarium pseudoanthophilum TaxID=48495 RepID=A0A8H5NM01_9HYPO|nr:hypothetical protein FPANT_13893 [Fusarium pseudoanthophilum]
MMLVLTVDSSFWQLEARLTTVLNLLDKACHFHSGSGEVYAPRHEARSVLDKIPEVKALDVTTKDAPFNYAYRLKTCFGQGKCQLADQETTILKGTFSYASLNVQTRGDDELPLPLPRRYSLNREKVGAPQSWRAVRVLRPGNKVDDQNIAFVSLQDKCSL